jgi:hypothetical protein
VLALRCDRVPRVSVPFARNAHGTPGQGQGRVRVRVRARVRVRLRLRVRVRLRLRLRVSVSVRVRVGVRVRVRLPPAAPSTPLLLLHHEEFVKVDLAVAVEVGATVERLG